MQTEIRQYDKVTKHLWLKKSNKDEETNANKWWSNTKQILFRKLRQKFHDELKLFSRFR